MEQFLTKNVVIDVESLFVYVGTLTAVSEKSVTLENADVHDLRDSKKSREVYVRDCKIHGVRPNRKKVLVTRPHVISISLLDDVIE